MYVAWHARKATLSCNILEHLTLVSPPTGVRQYYGWWQRLSSAETCEHSPELWHLENQCLKSNQTPLQMLMEPECATRRMSTATVSLQRAEEASLLSRIPVLPRRSKICFSTERRGKFVKTISEQQILPRFQMFSTKWTRWKEGCTVWVQTERERLFDVWNVSCLANCRLQSDGMRLNKVLDGAHRV
jgi:hypothetical protein